MTVSTERFRPQRLSEMIGQTEAVKVLDGFVSRQQQGGTIPHLLFHGSPGCGKTTAAFAFTRELLGPMWDENTVELNASDERGIEMVRDRIKPITGQMAHGAPFKVVFLDEADQLTNEAQQALRRVMESGASNTRFILACNKVSKITQALQSRCAVIAFRPLTAEQIETVLRHASEAEGIPVDEERLKSTVDHARGDARRAINMFLMGGVEADKFVQLDRKIAALFEPATSVAVRVESFCQFLREEGFTEWEEVLESIGDHTLKAGLPNRVSILSQIGTTAFRCSMVQNPLLQIRSWLYGAL